MTIPRKKKNDAVAKAAKKKRESKLTPEQAWAKIFAMKNSKSDIEKLKIVKDYMDRGLIHREPAALAKGKALTKAEALRLYADFQRQENERALREMVENTPDNYYLITDEDELQQVVDVIKVEDEIVFDVETTGTDIHSDYIVGHVLTAPVADKHFYIPTRHREGHQLDNDYVNAVLKPIYEDENLGKIAHNAKFDVHMLANEGIFVAGDLWDTQVAAHVLNENEPTKALKPLVEKYLHIPSLKYGDLFGKKGFDEIDLRTALAYAAKDGDITLKLRDFQRKHMERVDVLDYFEQVEKPLVYTVVRMERSGLLLDKKRAQEIRDPEELRLKKLDKQMRESFGVDGEFNFESPAQLKKLLYGKLGLDKKLEGFDVKRGEDGLPSTDKVTLGLLAPHHPGVKSLLEYRKVSKAFGTYFDKMPQRVKPDGYVYGEFNQDATDTGRFASREPNLQNIPYAARKMFVAPPGKVILAGDFSQQEPRILTHASQEPFLLEVYNTGQDFYTMAASRVFNLPPEQCGDGSKWRKMMKTGVLATMYGTGPKTLSEQLGISVDEAIEFLDDFLETYPNIKKFMDGLVKYAKQHGHIRMLMGRKRRVPAIHSRKFGEQRRAERQIKNSYVQGSAAIQTKATMLAIDEWCQRKTEETGEEWRIAFSIHDEIGIYAPETVTREEVDEFERIMLETVKLSVPNRTDLEISYRWGDGMTPEQFFMAQDYLDYYEKEGVVQ